MAARVELFGVQIDPLRMDEAVGQILTWARNGGQRCRFVLTPDVDHVVMLQHHQGLQAAYHDAGLVLVDGAPVLWSARLLNRPVPERVTGSDLVPALFDAVPDECPLRVYLLGAGPGVAERAAANIERQWPGVRIGGTYSPPPGFERDASENAVILARIAEAKPDVLVVGLGTPNQELWVHQHRVKIAAKVALCVGATIDHLAGEKSRAPRWLQRIGLEWFYRALSEPQRLAASYAKGAWIFPRLLAREWWQRRGHSAGAPAR
jgi:N-acetylglucosaminyldiphosphoundecaprenol N-acetyl-beta-D-mannosaminyltransferase